MACILHTGHDQGECWREHSGTTGWQKNLKTWFYIEFLQRFWIILKREFYVLPFSTGKRSEKEEQQSFVNTCTSDGTFWFSKPFLSRGFLKRIIYVTLRMIWLFDLNVLTLNWFFGQKKVLESSYIWNVSEYLKLFKEA